MRDFVKTWAKTHQGIAFEDWLMTLHNLYHGQSLEEKCITGMILSEFAKFRRQIPLDRLDDWLGQLEGWQEVDSTCQSCFTAKDLLARWDEWQPFLLGLSTDANINKRRASLVLLVKPIREGDERILSLALQQVDALKHEKDKLITKAVSWVLREGVKQHHDAITAYLDTNEAVLPAIAVRETRKKLETGKK